MADTTTKPAGNPRGNAPADEGTEELCIVDLGRQTRKRIRRLRRGQGPLMRKVDNAVEALREEGVIEGGAAVVVVLVRERTTLASLLDDDDDDYYYDDDDDDD
jgi:hypothetical protein